MFILLGITPDSKEKIMYNLKHLAGNVLLALILGTQAFAANEVKPKPVNVDNFNRAESDLYFAKFVKDGSFGKFQHARELTPIDKQDVIRMNRDTLYSSVVVDLDAGPVTVTIPDTHGRFMSMQVINEDHYTTMVVYTPGAHTFTRKEIGTRYVLFLIRTFVNPDSKKDLAAVHALQDKLTVKQSKTGTFEIPAWDMASAKRVRDALNALSAANGGIDSSRMFGAKGKVDPVHHLMGTAAGWGGNPQYDAYYEGVVPAQNNGKVPYRLDVKNVPVSGFWSISVYNKAGYFEKNPYGAYSFNSITAKPNKDGSFTIRFGDCGKNKVNCLPITSGWNYLVRLYRPNKSILDGSWKFPQAEPTK